MFLQSYIEKVLDDIILLTANSWFNDYTRYVYVITNEYYFRHQLQ